MVERLVKRARPCGVLIGGVLAGGVLIGGAAALVAGAPAAQEAKVVGARALPWLSSSKEGLVELGRRLFFEPTLSFRGERSCAACHDPDHGFSDPERFSRDDDGPTRRRSQSLIDVDAKSAQHWDGEFPDIAAVAHARMSRTRPPRKGVGYVVKITTIDLLTGLRILPEDPMAQGLQADLGPGFAALEHSRVSAAAHGAQRVHELSRYREAVRAVRPSKSLNVDLAADALEAYVRSLGSSRSPWDRFRAGEEGALTPAARRGLDLFQGRGGCIQCHPMHSPGAWPLLRDGEFHNTGVAWQARFPGPGTRAIVSMILTESGDAGMDEARLFDRGRQAVRGGPGHERAFKTPSLRDVASRPPYFHDGSRETLADVVRHYASGCGEDPARDPRLKGFDASPQDVDDLVAFLHALTSEERPGLARSAWKTRAERTRLVFKDCAGQPIPVQFRLLSDTPDRVDIVP